MGFLRMLGWDLFKVFVYGGVYYFARENCSEASFLVQVTVISLCLQIAIMFMRQLEKAVMPQPAPAAAAKCACTEPAAAATKN